MGAAPAVQMEPADVQTDTGAPVDFDVLPSREVDGDGVPLVPTIN